MELAEGSDCVLTVAVSDDASLVADGQLAATVRRACCQRWHQAGSPWSQPGCRFQSTQLSRLSRHAAGGAACLIMRCPVPPLGAPACLQAVQQHNLHLGAGISEEFRCGWGGHALALCCVASRQSV